MEFKDIHLDRLSIVRFSENHLTQNYVDWLNNPDVVKYSEQRHKNHTLESCRQYYEAMLVSDDLFLAIEATEGGYGHIGNLGVAFDKHNQVADVSILVGEKNIWGRGFATIAWNAVLGYLLREEAVRKVTAGTMSINTPMLRLIERSGMIIEGYRKNHFIVNNVFSDMVLAAKFKEDLTH